MIPLALATLCLLATLMLLFAEARGPEPLRAAGKIVASSAFVALALACGATGSGYGRRMLLALALSWVGDVLLLARRDRWFLLGIGAFLLAHVAYGLAFASLPLERRALRAGAAHFTRTAVVTLRGLWPHLTWF
jgi:uncharacterized membrane protein YhhN